MAGELPAITGKQLIRLFEKDGWSRGGRTTHGIALRKAFGERTRVTTIPDKRASLPNGTLGAILGPLQTGLGREGLITLISRFGLK
jgi:predicted RNA binding protein YcfA (HicA-like mRNA interferase family)